MKRLRLLLLAAIVLGIAASGILAAARPDAGSGRSPDAGDVSSEQDSSLLHPAFPDAYKLAAQQAPDLPVSFGVQAPGHLTHPCTGMASEPTFEGLSPLSIAYVSGMCSNGYGDIAVWQANGHSYVAQSGFALRMFHIWNVDDPYNPVLVKTQTFPAGGTASTTIFDFKKGGNYYMSVGMRGSGTGCGYFIYDVNDPANPVQLSRKQGADWCTVHEHFVSTDANGDADYAWLAMSGESGSFYKVVVLDLADVSNPVERGRYQRPDASGSIFVHDVSVIGNRVFLGHWNGGSLVHDKMTLVNNVNPTPLNPIDSIKPSSFMVHHAWPTSDGNHLFIEDEFLNASNAEKIKMYNISNIAAPYYELGIIGPGIDSTSQAHNLKILPMSPGLDLMFIGWYKAGTKGYLVDTTGPTPVITRTISHQLRQTAGSGFGNVWGVDYLPCTIQGQPEICVYSSDMTYGLYVDALGYDPLLDPYKPESQITNPINGQTINTCSYTIQGTAHDYYSGVSQVEVSTDNGSTWSPASGTANWTYNWTITANGSHTLKSRASDVGGNVEVPTTSIAVTVNGGCAPATATPTNTPTNTPTPTSVLTGHVTWQGLPAQPNALQQQSITLTLKSGAIEVNYPSQTTDASGFFTVSLGSLAPGTYGWRVKGPNFLANSGTIECGMRNAECGITISYSAFRIPHSALVEMGLMKAGDCNDDNVVSTPDFSILRNTLGKSVGDPGYDARADFNGDNVVNTTDFNLLRTNFGISGQPPLRPGR